MDYGFSIYGLSGSLTVIGAIVLGLFLIVLVILASRRLTTPVKTSGAITLAS